MTRMGQPADALPPFLRAAELTPDDKGIHFAIGTTYRETKQFPAAIAAYRKATELKPDYLDAHLQLGITFDFNDQPQAALDGRD